MNFLFTCVGRRVELIQEFQRTTLASDELFIYGTDCDETAPALYFCKDSFIVPRISNDSYIPALLEICKKNKIDLVIPTIDTDLLVLSGAKEKFLSEGTEVLISSSDLIKKCRDKRLTGLLFEEAELMFPPCVDDVLNYSMGFPAFIKPLDGSSSVNTYMVNSHAELVQYASIVPDYIIQPYIAGDEFTVDVFCDFEGNPIYITPRKRLAVRAGEVQKTEICHDDRIIEAVMRLVTVLKPCGPITVQLIRSHKDGSDWFIEINPRFGGGSPLSMKAGANSAQALVNIMAGRTCSYDLFSAKNHSVYSRYEQSILIQ